MPLLLAFSALGQSPAGPSPHPSHPPANRTYFGQDIFVAEAQQIHNATCIFCSVQVEGDLSGSVFVLFGNLTVTGRVTGDATVLGGNTVVDSQARINGRTLVLGGNAVYETDEALTGNAYVLGGHISSFAGRTSPRRRISLSPLVTTALGVLAVLLLAALVVPRTRTPLVNVR